MIFFGVIIAFAFLIALGYGIRDRWAEMNEPEEEYEEERPATDRSGWVYFATGAEGPVKIGMCQDEPTQHRLPELQTMSPIPLRIVHKIWAPDRREAEAALHELLAEYRLHGEWFDRDATLYYIDHLKGAA